MTISIPSQQYNLLEEPWIPVIDMNGNHKEINLLDIFKKAHNLKDIREPSPEFEFGIFRFLIALILDSYKITDVEKIKDLLEKNQFDDSICSYLENLKDRFDLFHPNYPFYQGGEKDFEKKDLKSVCNLFHHLPSATNPIFFNHSFEKKQAISAKYCVRALLALPVFSAAGGVGFSPSINGAPPIYELIEGKNLYQTLILNTYGGESEFPKAKFEVPWCSNESIEIKAQKQVSSYLHGLTWIPRYCKLIPEEKRGTCSYSNEENQILVKNIIFKPGWKYIGDNGLWRDPNVAYRSTKKGIYPMRFKSGRDFWRDYGPFMCLTEKDYENEKYHVRYERPSLIKQMKSFQDIDNLDLDIISLRLYTLESDKAKLKNWRRSKLSLPKSITFSNFLGVIVQKALDEAELLDFYIKSSLKHLFPRDCKGNNDGFLVIREQVLSKFWNGLFTPFQSQFIPFIDLNRNDPDISSKGLDKWANILEDISKDVMEEILDSFDGSAEYLKKSQKVRDEFFPRLYGIVNRLKIKKP